MSKGRLVTALLLVVAASFKAVPAPAYDARAHTGQCLNSLQTFDQEVARIGFSISGTRAGGGEPPHGQGGATPRRKLRAWWDAAYLYSLDGDEHSCEIILASMRKLYRDYLRTVEGTSGGEVQAKVDRRLKLSKAIPLSATKELLRTSTLIGAEIRNRGDEKIANIEDVVVSAEGQDVRYVIAGRGTGIGPSEKWIAIRWRDLRATDDPEVYVLDVDANVLDRAPSIERRSLEQTRNPEWQRLLDRYWNEVLKLT